MALWLVGRGISFDQSLADVLSDLYADAYLVGHAAAASVVDKADPVFGSWRPGDPQAAQDRLAELGVTPSLAAALERVPAVAQAVSGTRLEDVARVLLNGADTDTEELAAAVRDALGDEDRAHGVALTETVTVAGLAAMALYRDRGVEMGRWVTDSGNVCPLCRANADAGPVPIGEAYPSGATDVPQHPRCRCQIVPA